MPKRTAYNSRDINGLVKDAVAQLHREYGRVEFSDWVIVLRESVHTLEVFVIDHVRKRTYTHSTVL